MIANAKENRIGNLVSIRTGKLDSNASCEQGQYPFFTCAVETLRINDAAYDCECVLVAGNGDLNVKYYEGKFNAYQRTYIIESNDKDILDVRYLYYFMSLYIDRLRHMSIGGVIKYIKLNHLTDAPIPLPPLAEQKRIAAILDQADAIRQKRRQSIEKLNNLIHAIFYDMFGDPVTNPNGWSKVTFNTLFKLPPNYGTMQPPHDNENGWLDLRVANIQNGKLDLTSKKYVHLESSMIERHEVLNGDLLLARAIGSLEHLGKCIIVNNGGKNWAFDSHLMRIRFNTQKVIPEYIHSFLESKGGRYEFLKHSRRSAVQFNINTKEISRIEVPLPPYYLQKQYLASIKEIQQLTAKQEKAADEADNLFNSLVQRAFKGEL